RNIQKVEALAQDFHAAQAAAEPGTVMLPNAEVAAAKVTQTVSQTVPRFGVQNTEQFFGTHAERVFDVNLQARRILDELNHAQMIPELVQKAEALAGDIHAATEVTQSGGAVVPGTLSAEATESIPQGGRSTLSAEATESGPRAGRSTLSAEATISS